MHFILFFHLFISLLFFHVCSFSTIFSSGRTRLICTVCWMLLAKTEDELSLGSCHSSGLAAWACSLNLSPAELCIYCSSWVTWEFVKGEILVWNACINLASLHEQEEKHPALRILGNHSIICPVCLWRRRGQSRICVLLLYCPGGLLPYHLTFVHLGTNRQRLLLQKGKPMAFNTSHLPGWKHNCYFYIHFAVNSN